MPIRKPILVSGEVYHVFNRGNAAQEVFFNKSDYNRFLFTVDFYRFRGLPVKLSSFLTLLKDSREAIWDRLKRKADCWVEIYCFCLMPNHFHLLLKQIKEGGISKFVGQLQNSYTRYFNTKRDRAGSLFQGQFKAKRVVTEEQLVHLSRYIHLNPYSSGLVGSLGELQKYSYSSLSSYLTDKGFDFVNRDSVFSLFKDEVAYKSFVFDQADYQRELGKIKYLAID